SDEERTIRHDATPQQRRVDGVERLVGVEAKRGKILLCERHRLQRYRHDAFPPRIELASPAHRIDGHEPGPGGHLGVFHHYLKTPATPRDVASLCSVNDRRTRTTRGTE